MFSENRRQKKESKKQMRCCHEKKGKEKCEMRKAKLKKINVKKRGKVIKKTVRKKLKWNENQNKME